MGTADPSNPINDSSKAHIQAESTNDRVRESSHPLNNKSTFKFSKKKRNQIKKRKKG